MTYTIRRKTKPAAAVAVAPLPTETKTDAYPVMKWDSALWVNVPVQYDFPLREFINCPGDWIDIINDSAKTGALATAKTLRGAAQRISIILAQQKQARRHLNETMPTAISESNRKIAVLTAVQLAWAETLRNQPGNR